MGKEICSVRSGVGSLRVAKNDGGAGDGIASSSHEVSGLELTTVSGVPNGSIPSASAWMSSEGPRF
jgi:hypothetical protein